LSDLSPQQVLPWKDPLFLLALSAGPVCWLVLYYFYFQQPAIFLDKPVQYPGWFLKLVLISPILEEMVFRGFLQELIRDRISSKSFGQLTLANLLASLLFSAAHFFFHAPLWAALVFFPSLVFGFFKERTQRLTAPIVLHAFYNLGFIWLFTSPG